MLPILRTLSVIFATILYFNTAIAQPRIEQGNTQTWYGRVNRWPTSRETLRSELNLMKECGVSGYMIELAVWNGVDDKWSDEWIARTEKSYRWLLRECRKRKIWLFVSIVNDNMGKGKYGDTGPALEQVYNQAKQLALIVKKYGPKGVIIQPVAETQTSAGQRFEQECKTELEEFTLVYNGNGGHPKSTPEGFHFRAVHPSHIASNVADDALVISDHGLIIRELAIDNGLESKGNPTKVEMWAEKLRQQGIAVVGYYAFKYSDFDHDTIRALGDAVK
ncbi:MAG: hypothetical protein II217_02670 [Alistipes sp.]|nr:hypothetical protein [Alistipes sp.]